MEYQQQREQDLNKDIVDAEKAVISAKQELKDAQEWFAKKKVYYAEAIIKLHNYLKETNKLP